jgi:uncharacterized protein (DUF2147 family)
LLGEDAVAAEQATSHAGSQNLPSNPGVPRQRHWKTVVMPIPDCPRSGLLGTREPISRHPRRQPGLAGLLMVALMSLVVPCALAWAAVPAGVWLIDGKAAVQIYDCSGLLCGRILWLQTPRDPQGQLNRDRNNPNPALRQRRLCGLTVLWGLRPAGSDRWEGGWFYNPEDGETYNVSAELRSDLIVARIYSGIRLFGETKTLRRVPHGTSEGWC